MEVLCLSIHPGRFIPKEEGDLSVALPVAPSLHRMSDSISRELRMDKKIMVRKTLLNETIENSHMLTQYKFRVDRL